jgi:hypothetical protein
MRQELLSRGQEKSFLTIKPILTKIFILETQFILLSHFKIISCQFSFNRLILFFFVFKIAEIVAKRARNLNKRCVALGGAKNHLIVGLIFQVYFFSSNFCFITTFNINNRYPIFCLFASHRVFFFVSLCGKVKITLRKRQSNTYQEKFSIVIPNRQS